MSSLSPSKFKRKACKILLNDGHAIKNIQKKKKKAILQSPLDAELDKIREPHQQ
jgi:hypothetical protein